jgi:predicted lipoprotein with Yx(FWY)xxD motif
VPLEVPNSTSSIAVGPGVNGAIGFVPRTATRKQVTFNSYPLYRYIKDTAPGQAGGEGLLTYAGTWLVVDAAATTASHTPVYPTLESTNAGSFTGVLANHLSRSLYLFSIEKGSTVHCTGTCLKTWIPLEVHSKTTPITIGRSVNGHVGYVTRGTNLFQLTYNTYPIYTYVHDTAVGQTKGEGVATNGGTWYLVRASATTAADTPILPA